MQGGPERPTRARGRALALALLVAVAVVGVACSEEGEEPGSSDTTPDASEATGGDAEEECVADSIVECAPEGTSIEGLLPETPTPAGDGDPVVVGMINQEEGVGGAFPELSDAGEALVELVNTELGGVDGRPLELRVCDTGFSPDGSQSCAQEMVEAGAVAVTGGIDVFGDGIATLEENGIPYVGGIPVSFPSVESPMSFQFSGGSWGAAMAFAHHAVEELDAETVSIVYGEFGSIESAAGYGRDALLALGLGPDDVHMVPFPVVTDDLVTPLTAASESSPDAIFVLTADTGCAASFQAAADLGVDAQLYFVGACAAPTILDAAGEAATEGHLFNVEGPVSTEGTGDPDTNLYNAVIDRYGPEGLDAAGAGTVSFRSLMNLYVQMRELGADGIAPAAIAEGLRDARDHASFMGHAYTCDGRQMGGDLPAMCAPQQILARRVDGELVQETDWIDVGALRARSSGNDSAG